MTVGFYVVLGVATVAGLVLITGSVYRLQRARYRLRPLSKGQVGLYLLMLGLVGALCALGQWFCLPLLWICIGILPPLVMAVMTLALKRFPRLTARPVRLTVAAVLTYVCLMVTLMALGLFAWSPLLASAPPLLVRAIALPLGRWEERHNRRFVAKMKAKLASSGAITVGITGSAGKTTVKNLLTVVLGEGAYPSHGNYNTPMGLALSIKEMPPHTRYFVAEMGISHPGDMQALLDVVHPYLGILTNVLPQHTLTAGGVEEILAHKRQMLLASKLAIAPVGSDVARAALTVGEGGDWSAEEVVLHLDHTSFVAVHEGRRYPVTLPLLGRACVLDALFAFAAGVTLGVEPSLAASRLSKVERVPHRMQLTPNDRGITIIDDSYNLNIEGAKSAMEYLSLYSGRKVVTVSGIAESDPSLRLNERLGEIVSGADVVILVGERYRAPLLQGIRQGTLVHFAEDTPATVKLYQKLLRTGDVLLILADMPK